MAEFKLPKLRTLDKIVDQLGRPSIAFVNFFGQFSRAIETQENRQDEIIADLEEAQQEIIELNDVQDMLIEDLTEAQEDIVEIVDDLAEQQDGLAIAVQQIQALLGISQGAAQAANDAQASADEALADGTVSGSAQNPAVSVPGAAWVIGPLVSLTGVVAGNLTISGSGPLQDSDVAVVGGPGSAGGEWRIVEIDGITETTLFTGGFSAYQAPGATVATVTNDAAPAVTAYGALLTTTGALDYRIDARCTFGGLTSLKLYIYARRAA